ncbi:MAG: acetylxylan esterase [Verrucomicrobia bacterium]|nr:acetylxylan esterase [Verrucomicrobiota bacterium]
MNSTSKLSISAVASVLLVSAANIASAQPKGANYDEAKVPNYTLPDPLLSSNGVRVSDAAAWQQKRRAEVLELFRTHVYGHSPGRPREMSFEVRSVEKNALGGKATRKEVSVYFTGQRDGPQMSVLIYLPNDAQKPRPAFLGLNFYGNHAVHPDPRITLSKRWMRPEKDKGIASNRATEASRGSEASRWAVEKILARGYALATIYYGDLEPDFADGWKMGVRAAFRPDGTRRKAEAAEASAESASGREAKGRPDDAAPDDWGAIGAWAWGLSRALDYFESDKDIDAKRVAVIGHSRLGKTSLWAGAQDERFAFVISNNSGEGGAALSRRRFGETTERINTSFPHWFCANYKKYNNREDDLPVDQHLLIALMAPRPVYVASAQEDLWADPRGEFLSAKNAEPVYRLFSKEGLGVAEMPGLNQPVGKTIGYHIRTGKHDVTDYDWEQYLNFADSHLKK